MRRLVLLATLVAVGCSGSSRLVSRRSSDGQGGRGGAGSPAGALTAGGGPADDAGAGGGPGHGDAGAPDTLACLPETVSCPLPSPRCTSLLSNPRHCGACDTECEPLSQCLGGRCSPLACDEPFVLGALAIPAAGSVVSAFTAGDWNGDGKVDFAADITGAWLGQGDGSFVAAEHSFIVPGVLAHVDWDRDGNEDLVAVNETKVSIQFGDGAGSFLPAMYGDSYELGGSPSSVAIGDLDGDDNPDLAVTTLADSVVVILGPGRDGAASSRAYDAAHRALAVAIADFDGDGHADLATANDDETQGISVFLGNGDGSVRPRQDRATPRGLALLSAADLNGDGVPDLAASYVDSAHGEYNLLLFVGNGDATFEDPIAYNPDALPVAFAQGDVNGDGLPDVVASTHDAKVCTLFGTATGTPASAWDCADGLGGPLAVADLNCDGRGDLLVASRALTPLLGTGDGSFLRGSTSDAFGQAFPLALRDVDGDQQLDLLTLDRGKAVLSVQRGQGDGTFAKAADYPAGAAPASFGVGDVDGDGAPDIVVASLNGPTATVLFGTGRGGYTPRETTLGAQTGLIAVGDLNADGFADIAFHEQGSGAVSVALGDGSGSFAKVEDCATGADELAPSWLSFSDVDLDGGLDLVFAEEGGLYFWHGDGTGTFALRSHFAGHPEFFYPGVADLDGDGRLDLVGFDADRDLAVGVLGTREGTFTEADPSWLDHHPVDMALADLNGDGHADLVAAHLDELNVTLGAGDGTFACSFTYRLPESAGDAAYRPSIALGDVNGDGRLDVAISNDSIHSVTVLLNLPPSGSSCQ